MYDRSCRHLSVEWALERHRRPTLGETRGVGSVSLSFFFFLELLLSTLLLPLFFFSFHPQVVYFYLSTFSHLFHFFFQGGGDQIFSPERRERQDALSMKRWSCVCAFR